MKSTAPSESSPSQVSAPSKRARLAQLVFLVPGFAVAVAVGASIAGYEPLVFDPSLYEISAPAQAQALEIIDPNETSVRETGREYDGSLDQESFEMPANGLVDGVYTAAAYGYKSDIEVQVTISQGEIVAIDILSQNEDAAYFNRAVGVISSVLAAQSTSVDAVSGATFSSKGILQAINRCLAQAAANQDDTAADDSEVTETPDAPADSVKPTAPRVPVAPGESTDLEVEGLLDGEYTSYTYCADEKNPDAYRPYYLAVTIRVEQGTVAQIVDVYGTGLGEKDASELGEYDTKNDTYLDWAAWGRTIRSEYITYAGVADQIEAAHYQRVESYDVVSGATYSSAAVAKGYNAALDKARLAFAEAYRAGLIDKDGKPIKPEVDKTPGQQETTEQEEKPGLIDKDNQPIKAEADKAPGQQEVIKPEKGTELIDKDGNPIKTEADRTPGQPEAGKVPDQQETSKVPDQQEAVEPEKAVKLEKKEDEATEERP